MPKIASYPFTTLHPHTGKIRYDNQLTLTMADLPGLIEGAHKNKGLGHKFLKHIERAKILLFILDGSLNPNDERCPLKDLQSLQNEIKLFNPDMADKPSVIALNKMDIDTENFKINYEILRKNFKEAEIICVSGKESKGLEELTKHLKAKSDQMDIVNKKNTKF
jgi:GTP-binding protein